MEPVTLAVAVATLFFSEALKEEGKTLGKSASELAVKLIRTVRGKFKDAGTEGLLNRAENHPTQKHIDTVRDELRIGNSKSIFACLPTSCQPGSTSGSASGGL